MGYPDQFAKQTFAEETEVLTGGAVVWQPMPEIGLIEVRGDGLLVVREPARLGSLLSPWPLALGHDEIVAELKMQGDHLDAAAVQRTLLRRQARQVQRVEAIEPEWLGEEPVWVVAARVPDVLRRIRKVHRVAAGCYRVEPASFDFVWIAANELPLADELIPFLVARSGRALVEFVKWVASRRPPQWLVRMLEFVPMSRNLRYEIDKWLPPTDDPELLAFRRENILMMVDALPGLREELAEKGIEKGIQPLLHQFERKLGRSLTLEESASIRDRIGLLGPDRVGDVVLDLSSEALAAWLSDPSAA